MVNCDLKTLEERENPVVVEIIIRKRVKVYCSECKRCISDLMFLKFTRNMWIVKIDHLGWNIPLIVKANGIVICGYDCETVLGKTLDLGLMRFYTDAIEII